MGHGRITLSTVKLEHSAHRALALTLVLSTPIVAMARTPRSRPQQSAQTRPRADAGAPRADASAPVARADAGAPRADAAVAAPTIPAPPGGATVNRAYSAAQIVAGVQAFYNATTSFRANFRQFNTAAVSNTTTESAGVVTFMRPGRMRWEYSNPAGNVVISNGSTIWTYQASANQVFQANLQQSQLPTAFSFLMGSGSLARDFEARIRTTNAPGYQNYYMLELTPTTPNPNFARLVLFVEPQRYQVVEAAVIDQQNNRNRFQFLPTGIQLNVNWLQPDGAAPARPDAGAGVALPPRGPRFFDFTVPARATVIRP